VLGEAEQITVRLAGGEAFAGTLQGRDRRRDLAVVRFSAPPDLPTVRLGGSEAARVGDWVLAVGSPLGLNSSVTLGILSAVGRRGGPGGNISDFLQTDAVINPGNSGGALLNLKGQVIGINTWIASDSGSYEGYGFALPSASVQRGVRELLAKGRAADGWLGVSSIDPPPPMREELQLPNGRGALVANYYLGGPAQRAGIQLGDFLVQLDRRRITETAGLIQAAADASPHAAVRLRLLRRGQLEGLTVVLGERPPEQELAAENALLWPGWIAAGTELVQVFRGTPAARAGFRRNDRIVEVNGKPLDGLAGLFAFLNQALPVYRLTVERGESRLELDLPGQIVNPGP
jgi:S1-C subfamily serine protease